MSDLARSRKHKHKHRTPPGGKDAFSRKIAKVRRHDPSLSTEQAVGKAAGIMRHKAKKKRTRKGR